MPPAERDDAAFTALLEDGGRQDGVVHETDVLLEAKQARLRELADSEETVRANLADLDRLFAGRRRPIDLDVASMEELRAAATEEFDRVVAARLERPTTPPGPKSLSWVDSGLFSSLCTCVVAANFACMLLAPQHRELKLLFACLDQAFLVWYSAELGTKFAYHRAHLFKGSIGVVWWNWLDFGIVVCGIVDQWLVPLLAGGGQFSLPVSASALRALRLLRLFRVLRALKLLRGLLGGDLSWTMSPWFEVLMSVVIALNTVVMAMELDVEWSGWVWVEFVFLTVYVAELVVRMKRSGCHYFMDLDHLFWNYLDFIIVSAGVLDMCLVPLFRLLQTQVWGDEEEDSREPDPDNSGSSLGSLLRMLRIVRILRLVRLVKSVKPLFLLLSCIVESLRAMQWVLVLTLIVLYGFAICWTSLVGKGLIYPNQDVPDDVEAAFGEVFTSLFSLFRLMNGDTSIVDLVCTTVIGRLLVVAFVVLANWAILAILTSVVSDNMIASSRELEMEDTRKEKQIVYERCVTRLRDLFESIDADHSGTVSYQEWEALLDNPVMLSELADATNLSRADLEEFFSCLSVDPSTCAAHGPVEPTNSGAGSRSTNVEDRVMQYDLFMHHLRDEMETADRRSLLMLMSKIAAIERRVAARLDATSAE